MRLWRRRPWFHSGFVKRWILDFVEVACEAAGFHAPIYHIVLSPPTIISYHLKD